MVDYRLAMQNAQISIAQDALLRRLNQMSPEDRPEFLKKLSNVDEPYIEVVDQEKVSV